MARIKTSSFYISASVTDIQGTGTSTTMDISQFVDAPSGQAILIEEVSFVWYKDGTFLPLTHTSDATWSAQLKDSSTGLLVDPTSEDLVSLSMYIAEASGAVYSEDDMMPDVMGYAAGQGRLVISSNLQLTAKGSLVLTDASVACRVRCRVVNLDQKDWIALALQSVAE